MYVILCVNIKGLITWIDITTNTNTMDRGKSTPGTRGPKSKITQQLPDSFIALGAKQGSPRDDPKRTVPLPKSSVTSHLTASSSKGKFTNKKYLDK